MKDSFILYTNLKEVIDMLSDSQAGKLFKAIFEYQTTNKEPLLPDTLKLIFIPIKQNLDKNNEKYLKIVERNKENGRLGGRPKNPNNPDGFFENPKKPKKADNDNEYDNDIKKENITKEKKFIKPTISEIQNYCKERKNSVDANKFYDFYESKGWKVGKTQMKDWKACVRTWETNNKPTESTTKFHGGMKIENIESYYDNI